MFCNCMLNDASAFMMWCYIGVEIIFGVSSSNWFLLDPFSVFRTYFDLWKFEIWGLVIYPGKDLQEQFIPGSILDEEIRGFFEPIKSRGIDIARVLVVQEGKFLESRILVTIV